MIIETGGSAAVSTRPAHEVLGIPNGGPSARGATWWKRFLACPREHALVNLLQWRPRGLSKALDFGLIWHWLLENYYLRVQAEQGGQTFPESADTYVFQLLSPLGIEPGYDEAFQKISTMLDVYLRRWEAHDNKHFEILAVEATLDSTAGGFPYSARLDLLVKDHSISGGVVKTIEHKSASALDTSTVSGYNQDIQILGQIWLVGVEADLDYYGPFLGSVVNITTKSKIPQTLRVPVQPSTQSIAAWKASMLFWWRQYELYEKAGYPQNFGHCVRRYSRCEMWEICYHNPGKTVAELEAGGPPEGYRGPE